MSKKRVLVLMGGPSSEHEVSLNTGKEVIKNLDKQKYIAEPVVITKKGNWLIPPVSGNKQHRMLLSEVTSTSNIAYLLKKDIKPDVVFIAMHGEFGEDGTIQGLLESLGVPYTGSGISASALGMDKPKQATLFRRAGLAVPKFAVIQKSEWRKNKKRILPEIIKNFAMPCVVKPANRGSSVGVAIVMRKGRVAGALKSAFSYSDFVVIQKFIKGREITCGVVEDRGGKLIPMPPIEILAKAGNFYDYNSKYADGGSKHIIPPRNISKRLIKKIQITARLAHKVLGCRGLSRTDFILSGNGKLYILEINTLPGMTKTSLLPESAKAAGIGFSELLDMIIRSAVRK